MNAYTPIEADPRPWIAVPALLANAAARLPEQSNMRFAIVALADLYTAQQCADPDGIEDAMAAVMSCAWDLEAECQP